MTQRQAVEAVLEGRRQGSEARPGIDIGILLCMMCVGPETANWEANAETVETAAEYLGQGVVGIDLAGAEGIVPLRNFAPLFQLAREKRIPFTCHAGDSPGPDTVADALDFGARRIGHGQHPGVAVKVQPRAEFREKPFDGPPDSLPHASASMPSVISCPEKRTVRTLSPLTTHPGRMDGIKVMTLPPVAKARENTTCGISTGRSGQRESRQLPTKIFPSPCVCQT